MLPLLSVFEDFERALAADSTDRPFYEGVRSIHRLFLAPLRETAAKPLDCVGKHFDSMLPEAVASVAETGAPSRVVVTLARED